MKKIDLVTFLLIAILVISSSVIAIATETLPFELDIPVKKERPDLAAIQKSQIEMTLEASGEMDTEMLEMMDIYVWAYEVEGEPEKVIEDIKLPSGASQSLEERDLGEAIMELVDNFGAVFDEVWEDDWSYRAEELADEYSGRELTSYIYQYSNSPMDTISISITSPGLNMKTLEVIEGTFLMVHRITINMGMMNFDMGDED